MSMRIELQCVPLQMAPAPKAVLMAMADMAREDGTCQPSVGVLCERTCFSRSTVRRALDGLIAASLVKAEREPGQRSRYRVTPPDSVTREQMPRVGRVAA